jgi:hypothetical protein
MVKVLFVPPNGREVAQFALVEPELERLGGEATCIVLDDRMEAVMRNAGFRFKRLEEYRTMNMVKIIDEERPDLVLTNPIGSIPIPYALALAAHYRGIPCLQIYNGMIAHPDLSSIKGRYLRPLTLFLGRLLRTITDISIARSVLCLWLTIKATSNGSRLLKRLLKETRRFALPIGRSHLVVEGVSIALPGQSLKDIFINMGFAAERLFVTGQPRLDEISQVGLDGADSLAELGIEENKDVAVLATHPLKTFWSREDRKRFLSHVTGAMRNFPDEQMVIKLHPDEYMDDYRQLLTEIGCNDAIVCQDVSLYELLNKCNLLMTTHSTTALEAMLFDKPVICIDFTGRCPISFYTSDGAAIGVNREQNLIPAIDRALHDPQTSSELAQGRRRFIEKHVHRQDGGNSRRVAELIIRLAQEARNGKCSQDASMYIVRVQEGIPMDKSCDSPPSQRAGVSR